MPAFNCLNYLGLFEYSEPVEKLLRTDHQRISSISCCSILKPLTLYTLRLEPRPEKQKSPEHLLLHPWSRLLAQAD